MHRYSGTNHEYKFIILFFSTFARKLIITEHLESLKGKMPIILLFAYSCSHCCGGNGGGGSTKQMHLQFVRRVRSLATRVHDVVFSRANTSVSYYCELWFDACNTNWSKRVCNAARNASMWTNGQIEEISRKTILIIKKLHNDNMLNFLGVSAVVVVAVVAAAAAAASDFLMPRNIRY